MSYADTIQQEYLRRIERQVMRRGYRFCNAWFATKADVARGELNPYDPACQEDDLLVELVGFDPGSVPWVEVWSTGRLVRELIFENGTEE